VIRTQRKGRADVREGLNEILSSIRCLTGEVFLRNGADNTDCDTITRVEVKRDEAGEAEAVCVGWLSLAGGAGAELVQETHAAEGGAEAWWEAG
jgi:hypothetical protein